MKCLILSENSNGTWPHLHFRSMGSYELRNRLETKGHTATIIEWFTKWSEEQLKSIINDYKPDIIATSTPFHTQDLYYLKDILKWVRDTYPDIKVIHGGSRQYDDEFEGLIDVFFLGRSMEIFDAWLDNKDLKQYTLQTEPLVLVNHQFDEFVDNPVIPKLKDEDFISSKDILGFELGVGCKFNCSFCNYELRNAKITNLADPKELHNYFLEAYEKYGVTNFFASDDTINETDTKLEILAEAIRGLPYHPQITAFARLDLVTSKPKQLKLLEEINFRSLFFGIESFNPEASKLIRKKSGIGDNIETLRKVKETCDTYTVGGMILGLNGDSEESIRSSVNQIIEEKLLSSIQYYPLSITMPEGHYDPYFASDIDKDPESFDYKIIEVSHVHHGNKQMPVYIWKSDWTDFREMGELQTSLHTEIQDKIESLNHLEYAGMYALNLHSPMYTEKARLQLQSQCYSYANALKSVYIEKKIYDLSFTNS
jgi:hypothetical protein